MKKYFVIYLLLISSVVFSQDTLFLVNGTKEIVKVFEINPDVVKYRKQSNLNGPSYSQPKENISLIKYFGGGTDTFNLAIAEKEVIVEPVKKPTDYLDFYRGKITHNYSEISVEELKSLINKFPDETRRKKMQAAYLQMEKHRINQSACLAGGLVLGCAVVVLTAPLITGLTDQFLIPTEEGMQVAIVGILAGAAMRISGFAVSTSQKNKKKAKLAQIAAIYNGY